MPESRARVGALMLAAAAGASAWLSLGALAVTDDRTLARMAALPPLWLLAVLVVASAVAAAVARLSTARAWPLAICGLLWLPYLPGRIPGAFLIWHGPIETLIWCTVAAGLLGNAPAGWFPRLRTVVSDPRRAPWLAAAVAAACWGGAFAAVDERIPGGDEPHYLIITQSLLLDHDLRIENNHRRGDYLPYFAGYLRPDYLQRGADREIYPIHPPGISVLILPAFAAAGYLGAVATVIAGAALASALAWTTAWLLSASVGGAWAGWAGVFLSAPFFFHGFTIYPDGVGGLLVMAGVWLLVQFENRRDVGLPGLGAAGVALAALPWFHTRFALLAGAIGLTVVARLITQPDRLARLGSFLAVPVVSAAAWLGYFWIIWGTPDPSAPYGSDTNIALENVWRGAAGLLLDQQFGLIANAPVYALAVAGWLSLAWHKRRLALELLVITVPYFIAAASYGMWWGGVSAPARFLVTLLPVAALPIAWWWRQRSSTAWHALALLLVLVSVLITVARAGVGRGRLLYNARDGFDLLLDWAARGVDLPLAFPSVHRGATAAAFGDAAVWVVAGLLLAAVTLWIAGRGPRRVEGTWTAVTVSAAVAAMLASTVVWARHGVIAVTPTRSQVATLRAWSPAWQTTTVSLRPLRALSEEAFTRRFELGSTDRGVRDAADPTMLRATWLPAADYDIVTRGGPMLSGELFALVGRTEVPVERWRLEGRPVGFGGLTLRLPVPVQRFTIRGDGAAKASASDLTLRIKRLRVPAIPGGRTANRAARWGRARAFFLDDRAFMEPLGFWTSGESSSTVVLDLDETAKAEGPTVWFQSGLVATSVDVAVGAWTERVSLAARQRRSVTLPPPAAGQDSWVVTLNTGAGFRPFDRDPQSQDVRNLGVWVEIR